MSYELMVALSYSIVLPVIGILYQYKRVDTLYRPVMLCIVIGLVNEVISSLVAKSGHSNALNNNIYCLAEALLLLTQFKRCGLFDKTSWIYPALCIFFAGAWMIENHNWDKLNQFAAFFHGLEGATIVVLSIIQINILVAHYEGRLISSAGFIFCGAFCFYFCNVILLEIFLEFGKGASAGLRDDVFKAYAYANVITNIIYLTAILCIPRKQRSIV